MKLVDFDYTEIHQYGYIHIPSLEADWYASTWALLQVSFGYGCCCSVQHWKLKYLFSFVKTELVSGCMTLPETLLAPFFSVPPFLDL